MPTPFGAHRVRFDPWEVDYGPQVEIEDPATETPTVDHTIEVAEADWRPIGPTDTTPAIRRALFVDGVRRLDIRLHVRKSESLVYGAFGCYAVGATGVGDGAAKFERQIVGRLAILGAGERFDTPISVRTDLSFEPDSTPSLEPDGPLRRLHVRMREAESAIAREIASEEALTVVDGPLGLEPAAHGTAIGFVKRVHELYLPARLLGFVASLPAETRTPLFTIAAAGRGFARYSWFTRLAQPSRGATDMHGIVRLEVAAGMGLESARALADAATSWLPRFAPSRGRDPRSPQNLLPIGALERQLRQRLGDARLVRRWIETFIAKEASV